MLAILFFLMVLDWGPYTDYIGKIPQEHLALVKSIEWSEDTRGHANSNGTIRIPIPPREGVLEHEVGHLVSWANGKQLLNEWRQEFWPEGSPREDMPSRYARTNAAEDFAESYRRWIKGDLQCCCTSRENWMNSRMMRA